jgi:hypothetical protein
LAPSGYASGRLAKSGFGIHERARLERDVRLARPVLGAQIAKFDLFFRYAAKILAAADDPVAASHSMALPGLIPWRGKPASPHTHYGIATQDNRPPASELAFRIATKGLSRRSGRTRTSLQPKLARVAQKSQRQKK